MGKFDDYFIFTEAYANGCHCMWFSATCDPYWCDIAFSWDILSSVLCVAWIARAIILRDRQRRAQKKEWKFKGVNVLIIMMLSMMSLKLIYFLGMIPWMNVPNPQLRDDIQFIIYWQMELQGIWVYVTVLIFVYLVDVWWRVYRKAQDKSPRLLSLVVRTGMGVWTLDTLLYSLSKVWIGTPSEPLEDGYELFHFMLLSGLATCLVGIWVWIGFRIVAYAESFNAQQQLQDRLKTFRRVGKWMVVVLLLLLVVVGIDNFSPQATKERTIFRATVMSSYHTLQVILVIVLERFFFATSAQSGAMGGKHIDSNKRTKASSQTQTQSQSSSASQSQSMDMSTQEVAMTHV